MDRELPENIRTGRKLTKLFYIIGVISIMVVTLFGFRSLLKPTVKRSRILTNIVVLGPVEDAITASGIVIPENEQVITSPIESRIDSIYFHPGEKINAGQSVLELNDESIQIEYEKLTDQCNLKKNRETLTRLELEQTLLDLEAQLDIKNLRIQYNKSKLEMEKQLLEIGSSTKDAFELAELNLAISQREADLFKQQMDNKKKSLKADLREQELEIQISEKNLSELNRQIELSKVKSEIDGVVTWVNENIGASVYPGEIIAKIADLGSFKVEGQISDIHIDKLDVGMSVRVRINRNEIYGLISSVRPTIKNGVVTFLVQLNDKSNSALRSNLRADVFVIRSCKENVLRVKNGPAFNGSGRNSVFLIEGNKAIRKEVLVGAVNFDYVEILEGLNSGDEVIISDMEKHKHQKKVYINNK